MKLVLFLFVFFFKFLLKLFFYQNDKTCSSGDNEGKQLLIKCRKTISSGRGCAKSFLTLS